MNIEIMTSKQQDILVTDDSENNFENVPDNCKQLMHCQFYKHLSPRWRLTTVHKYCSKNPAHSSLYNRVHYVNRSIYSGLQQRTTYDVQGLCCIVAHDNTVINTNYNTQCSHLPYPCLAYNSEGYNDQSAENKGNINWILVLLLLFYSHYTGQTVSRHAQVMNWMILFEQFTASMPLLTATWQLVHSD